MVVDEPTPYEIAREFVRVFMNELHRFKANVRTNEEVYKLPLKVVSSFVELKYGPEYISPALFMFVRIELERNGFVIINKLGRKGTARWFLRKTTVAGNPRGRLINPPAGSQSGDPNGSQ